MWPRVISLDCHVLIVQITCQVCGQVSEREEEFLDLPVALSGHSGLEDALKESYIKLESLEKQNQYYCSWCKELVDAKRVGRTLYPVYASGFHVMNS